MITKFWCFKTYLWFLSHLSILNTPMTRPLSWQKNLIQKLQKNINLIWWLWVVLSHWPQHYECPLLIVDVQDIQLWWLKKVIYRSTEPGNDWEIKSNSYTFKPFCSNIWVCIREIQLVSPDTDSSVTLCSLFWAWSPTLRNW